MYSLNFSTFTPVLYQTSKEPAYPRSLQLNWTENLCRWWADHLEQSVTSTTVNLPVTDRLKAGIKDIPQPRGTTAPLRWLWNRMWMFRLTHLLVHIYTTLQSKIPTQQNCSDMHSTPDQDNDSHVAIVAGHSDDSGFSRRPDNSQRKAGWHPGPL